MKTSLASCDSKFAPWLGNCLFWFADQNISKRWKCSCLVLACVASVSVRFRSKEWGTRVKDRAKNGASKRAGTDWFSFHFSRCQNRKSLSTVYFCSETKRKRLLRRLAWSLDGVFPVPLGQFTSVTYPRRTGRKRLDKNRMRVRALLFEIQDFVRT